MRKLFLSICVTLFILKVTSQTCNNWLSTPSLNSTVNIGNLNVAGDQLTVEATINRTLPYILGTTDNSDGDVVSKHNSPADVNYLLRPNNASITTNNGFFSTPDICPLSINKTYHIALVYDGNTLKFYRNGFLMSQINATGNLFQNNWNTRFGLYDPSYWKTQFVGYINEVRIWNVARTQAQLNSYMITSLPSPTTQAGLLGYYTFDNLLNKQGNASFNGTLTGAASINETNSNCILVQDSCAKIIPAGLTDSIINNYTPILNVDVCTNKIIVENASSFYKGDTVLIMQMKGASIDSSNTASFGTINNYNNAGNYEFNYVKGVTGNVIEFLDSLTRSYDIPAGKVQLIRVPYYKTANVNSLLTCLPWDGNKGGVLVLNASDTVNLHANIDVSGKGFSGGKSINTGITKLMCFYNDYFYPANSVTAAAKGEGIASFSDNIAWGKGSAANAGGGGLGHNSGGGGGGNAGTGGFGGYQLEACGNAPFDNRGIGGKSLLSNNSLNKVFMGGGGGSGHTDNANGADMNGGYGAGIIIINTKFIKTNGFNILAKGGDAQQCSNAANNCHDGSGGGGGGGSVLINNTTYVDAAQINCAGGKGGDLVIYNTTNAGHIGPGGGGGAGVTWFNNSILPTAVTPILSGGVNGVIILDNNNPWGATPGNPGVSFFNLQLPIDLKPFKKNIDSTQIIDSTISCNSVNFKGNSFINKYPITNWLWNFGDNTTASTQNITHVYTQAGTFKILLVVTDINGCTDSVKKNIYTTAVGTGDFSYQQDVCNPLTLKFFSTDVNPTNPLWNFGDGNNSVGKINPIHTYLTPGTFPIKYSIQSGACTDTITKIVVVDFKKDNIILTPDTTICFGSTKQLLTVPALNFCWSPITYLDNPLSANPTTSTPVPITYYFTAQIQGQNLITNGDFSAGNSGFTSSYIYKNPTITEAEYFIGTNPQLWSPLLSPCKDHTTGNGNMMLVNGASVSDVNVWSQTVMVTPNTNYAFSTWVLAMYPPNPAQLIFSINNKDMGTVFSPVLPTCTWNQFYTTWNSGNNTTASISIVNKNTAIEGNDFALDDISFAPVLIKIDSVIINIDKPYIQSNKDTIICAGASVQLLANGTATYNWSPKEGLSNTGINNPIASPAISTQYIVIGTDAKGCTAADTVLISTKPLPIVQRTADTLICNNVTAQLWATGGNTFQWSPAGSLSDPAIANPVASPISNTIYHVLVTGTNNCTAKDSVNITILPAIIFAVSPPDTTCTNKTVQLSASGGDSYLWSPAARVSNAGIANPLSATTTDVVYTVLIKDNTCNTSKTLSTSLTVLPAPIINITKSNDISCIINTAQLTATGATQYSWTPATGLSDTTIANPISYPEINTNYIVTGFDQKTKCSATYTVTVLVTKEGEPKFFIPTAFSPNGDGRNECFKVSHFNYLKSVEISIFNRFGNIVFHTTTDNDCWDGTYRGAPQDAGNYVYYIKTQNNCGVFYKKGNLLLIR